MNLKEIHKHCSSNKSEIRNSKKAGCFYCQHIFDADLVNKFVDDGGETAICPFCEVDSVIGDASGIEIDEQFLKKMHEAYF